MKFKNYRYTFFALLISILSFSQTSTGVKTLPQLYETLPGNSAGFTVEKLLTAKELVDINLNGMMGDAVLRNADWGFVVYDPKTNKIVSSYNETAPLVPASTTKLLTTETALNLLGEHFKWTTQLEHSGEIDAEGVLNGNLYIIGSGDPSLGTGKAGSATYGSIVNDFIYAITEEKGIKKINGNIIIQTALFKDNKTAVLPENIVWMEHHNYYLPVGTTKDIEPRNEKLIAPAKNMAAANQKKFFYISPYVNKMVFADEYTPSPYNTSLPAAPSYLASSLKNSLVKRKIYVSGGVITKAADDQAEPRKYITAYKSPTLGEIVRDTNKRSDNALAEALLKTVGFQKMGDQTAEAGRSVVLTHLLSAGFDAAGLNYSDGSGLSRANKVTPLSQVKYLSSLMSSKYYNSFFSSLPVAGQDGTLKSMFVNNEGNGKIFAKTGTLNKVKTLAGYIKTETGKTLAFSILINNYAGSVGQVKSKMEELLKPVLKL